jgi:hypothetical protein
MDRRTALAGMLAAGLATAGCDLLSGEPPAPHALQGLLDQTRSLRDLYQRTIAAHADLADRLTPLRKDHQAHIAALAELIGPSASASPSGSPSAGADVPPDPKAAVAALLKAEQVAQEAAVKVCLTTRREYAGLVGSIAACRATHREVLRERA